MQVADELEKLARLRDDGVISEDIFTRAKTTIFASSPPRLGVADELEKLAKLRANKVISGEELARQELALLGPALPSAEPATGKKAEPPKWARNCGCVVLLVLAVLVLVGLFGSDPKNEKPAPQATPSSDATPAPVPTVAEPETPAERQATRVTVTELSNAYDANEAAAQRRYGDQQLLVSGTVNGVELDMFDKPSVKLRTPNEFLDAQATLTTESEGKADALRKGKKVELLCESVSEVMSIPMLKNCSIQ